MNRSRYLVPLAVLFTFGITAPLAQQFGWEEAQAYLDQHRADLGLGPADLSDLVVTDHYESRHNGVTHLYLQQRSEGVPVFNAVMSMAFLPDGRVLTAPHRFVAGLEDAITSRSRVLGPAYAAGIAAAHVGLRPERGLEVVETPTENEYVLGDAGISLEPIPVELILYPLESGDVRLAWLVGIYTVDAQHYWSVVIDAETGEVLREDDLVVHDHWALEPSLVEVGRAPAASILSASIQPPAVVHGGSQTGGQYRVFKKPIESPSHAGDPVEDLRALVLNPANPVASPLGWHDTGSVSYTLTRGNNVHAYSDRNNSNFPDPDGQPDGGPNLDFDFPLDFTQHPSTYTSAAVVNLFYWNNIVHDVAYRYGFDEPAGNFQVNNFGLGGLGGDPVRAEAQDGGGTNNANFFTPVDGNPPRMQMYIWTNPNGPSVTVHEPEAVAGSYQGTGAAFGPPLDMEGVTGSVVLAIDDAGSSTVCSSLTSNAPAIAGNIAMIDRGDCTFVSKIMRAQDAGAIGVIMVNNVGGNPITMGGDGPNVAIPSIMISLNAGNIIKPHLPDGVEATLAQEHADRDSDFDAGVIVHEYGHGINHRLTGGPNTVQCLRNIQRGDEGWADWWGLMLTGGDIDHRGIGTYLRFQPTDGPGIRPARYSTSMSINPFTYADIANLSVPHGVGFVWASMLWDMTQLLIDEHGYDPDLYTGAGGNNLALQLVMDGLKLQPCSPGFVDARDAILAADVALTDGDNQCRIWQAFARRGLGYSASQGSTESTSGVTEAFDLPAACEGIAAEGGPTDGAVRLEPVFPNPATAAAHVTFTLPSASDVTVEVFDLLGRRVTTLASEAFEAGTHELQWGASSVGAGVYVVRLRAGEQVLSTRVTVVGSG